MYGLDISRRYLSFERRIDKRPYALAIGSRPCDSYRHTPLLLNVDKFCVNAFH